LILSSYPFFSSSSLDGDPAEGMPPAEGPPKPPPPPYQITISKRKQPVTSLSLLVAVLEVLQDVWLEWLEVRRHP
jgi:hypothetical protein